MTNIKGFTLVELLLVVGLIGVLVSLYPPVTHLFSISRSVDADVAAIIHMIRRAQTLSRAVYDDSGWGTFVSAEQIILFKGTDFNTRDVLFDEVHSLSSVTNVTGTSSFAFDALFGDPFIFGTMEIMLANGKTISVTVNEHGTILY